MKELLLRQVICFSAPMFVAVICAFIILIYNGNKSDPPQALLSKLVIFTFISAAGSWLGLVFFVVDYTAFVVYNAAFFLALMLDQVVLYHFVHTVTTTRLKDNFRIAHYLIPCLITLIYLFWSGYVPFEVKYSLVKSRGQFNPDYPLFSYGFYASTLLFCIYNIFYSVLGFIRIRKYQRIVLNYSADAHRSSLRWLYILISLILLTIPIPFATIFANKRVIVASPLSTVGALLPIFQYLLITYNLLKGNYLIITQDGEASKHNESYARIDRKRFEEYIINHKPYLNPKLRITEMCGDLHTNRSYLSAFINTEYGVNFCSFVNRLRLQELDRLRIQPQYADFKTIDLVVMAGFSSYSGYRRISRTESRIKTSGSPRRTLPKGK